MVLAMSRPWKHPETGSYYFRKAVPDDLRPLIGKREEKRSLRTKDPAVAKQRHTEVAAEVERAWRAYRAKPEPLSQREITALAGLIYNEWVGGKLTEEPGGPSTWSHVLRLNRQAREAGKLEQWVGPVVDELLLRQGIRTDAHSRDRLIDAVDKAFTQAAEQLRRNAEGDYRPDPEASRFPEWEGKASAPGTASTKEQSLTALIEGWWQEAKATGITGSTHESYRNTMTKLVAFLGHDDARRVTSADIIRFKDMRLAEINPRTGKPISPKTVKDSDLAGLKAVFSWAVRNQKMPDNPAAGITIKVRKLPRLRSKGFTDAEAQAILHAAASHKRGQERPKTAAAKRWVPWLCAYTGARVGEIVQLRRQDIRCEEGRWIMTITPEAGTVKDKQAREVPLHDHLVEQGFADFVTAASEGYLFLYPSSDGDVLGPLQGVKNRLTEFVREVVSDKNVAPNHGWRHRFKSVGHEVGVAERVLDAICGHAPRSVGASYGDVTMKAKVAAISMFPRYPLKSG